MARRCMSVQLPSTARVPHSAMCAMCTIFSSPSVCHLPSIRCSAVPCMSHVCPAAATPNPHGFGLVAPHLVSLSDDGSIHSPVQPKAATQLAFLRPPGSRSPSCRHHAITVDTPVALAFHRAVAARLRSAAHYFLGVSDSSPNPHAAPRHDLHPEPPLAILPRCTRPSCPPRPWIRERCITVSAPRLPLSTGELMGP